jgi:hypothetical protein
MHMLKPMNLIVSLLAASGIAAFAASALADAQQASSPATAETAFMSYTPAPGPEMTPSATANLAVREARASGESGELRIELARGTLTQARALMEGGTVASAKSKEAELGNETPSSTFCFGGQNAACTPAEQQHAKEVLAAEGRAATYLVAVSGARFAPAERLPRGATPVVGGKMLLLIDAHTGLREGMSIGAGTVTPRLGELQAASSFVAPAASSTARAASAPVKPTHTHPRPSSGIVRGTFTQGREVVLFSHRTVFARAHVSRGRFRTTVHEGAYTIAGRRPSGRYCRASHIVVHAQRETAVHLGC